MYFATANDRVWELYVWGRLGKNQGKAIRVAIFRHTETEAQAYVRGLGYEMVGV